MHGFAGGHGRGLHGAAGLALAVALAATAAAADGVVVEGVAPGYGGHAAGVAAGDVILSWSRAPLPPANPRGAHGAIRTAFDLLEVEIEQAPRGPVTLTGRRGKATVRWRLPRDEWKLDVSPRLPPELQPLHEEARRRRDAEKLLEAAALWEQAAGAARRDPRLAGWLLLRAATAAMNARDWRRADPLFEAAVAALEPGGPIDAALVLSTWAETFGYRAAWKDAGERYQRALALREGRGRDSLLAARLLRQLGDADFTDEAAADAHYRRALALREQLAPESGPVAESLTLLGRLAARTGDLAAAEQHLTHAVRIREAIAPGSVPMGVDLTALARTLTLRGDHAGAAARIDRALAMLTRLAPKSVEAGYALSVAGLAAMLTGDLAGAEEHHRRSLEVFRGLLPNGMNAASALRALSTVAWTRRDYATAEDRAKGALAIMERAAPGTVRVSELLHQLGDIALDRGDLPGAEDYFRRALALDQTLVPDGVKAANDLRCLSLALVRSGRAAEAEPFAQRSAEIRGRLIPGSLDLAQSLMALGEIALAEQHLDAAEARYREAVAITARFVPGSRQEVEAQYGLGLVLRQAGQPVRAADAFERAIDAVERQRRRIGGTDEARTGFSAAYSRCYQEAMEVLVELGQFEGAFRVLERSRARALLDLLGERELLFSADLPPELARARSINQATYDRVYAELEGVDREREAPRAERLMARLRELREESAALKQKVREASPRLASLQQPEIVDLKQARATLESDGSLVAYAVGRERTLLFVVEPAGNAAAGSGLSVTTLPVGEQALRDEVESLRDLIVFPYRDDSTLRARAASLYDRLLRPAERALQASTHIAVSPDGALHLLPFAALLRVDPGARPAAGTWLAEWRALHIVGSASHYAEIQKRRRDAPASQKRLVAFGDPVYPEQRAAADPQRAPESGPAGGWAAGLGRLPFSRREVEAISGLFGASAVSYLGADATEARVKAGLDAFAYVHFACHGLLNEQFPLHSALALSPPSQGEGTDNGLLQVWEILDSVRLNADLVTLSACKTGLGRQMGGEGLQGLTRAFLYAGARSVVASLWSASDEATADLMVRFYTSLEKGRPKALALQDAQRDRIRAGSPPFHWATFEVFGDWR